ncbi:acyltransferase [Arthrobacter sp. SLBN-83]|uniref:acyltransferase n=1 Tax=Arthrobacter sp. SLBN-83 TaxID=2768449 RepID=UPI001153B9C3|nr:acyltransferase [Arthrobacter sp. SLBN-83]
MGINTDRAVIYPHIRFLNRGRVRIARDVLLNSGITFENRGPVHIERSVSIGPEVYIGTSTHAIGPSYERAGVPSALPVRIGAGTWIGARAVILPGVTIGAGCVIAAGAVVPRDCEPNSLYAGVPARRIRALSEDDPRATVATH